jgi:hypothetical protein
MTLVLELPGREIMATVFNIVKILMEKKLARAKNRYLM